MPSLSVQDATVGEFDGFVDLVVTLDTASTSTVTVSYRQFDATAGNDSDHPRNTDTPNFAPGETSLLDASIGTVLACAEGPSDSTFQVGALPYSILERAPSARLRGQWTALQDQLGDLTATAQALLSINTPEVAAIVRQPVTPNPRPFTLPAG
jgi:hypothetical protein